MSTTEIYALDPDWDLILHLADPESVKVIRAERLSPEIIEDELAREVLKWQIEHVRQHKVPASASVLEDQFEQVSLEKPQTAIGDLITRLRERYSKNEGRKAIRELTETSSTEPLTVGTEMLKLGKRITDLTSTRGAQFGTGDVERAFEVYQEQEERGPGPTLGFKELDQHFYGMRGITVLLAPPGTYKSWFAVNDLIETVMEGRHSHLYSLELPAEDTYWRTVCMASDVPYWKYERGALTNAETQKVNIAAEGLDACGSFNVEKPPPGERGAQLLIERALAAGSDCVFIDQLQYVENEKGVNLGALNDTGCYWDVLSMFRDYSDEIPIFIVHQFNRSVLNAKEMPEMQQAKGSAAIEETAHLALGLWANKEMRRNNIIEVGTLKSRSYSFKSWHMEASLSKDCRLEMIGEVTDDDE